ncbi:amino acid ABC transporter [Vibrio navarrensis]|nr:amino acid ABC transporter [Vibrio navarrensis]
MDWDGEKLADTEQQIGAHLGFSIVNELKKKQLKVQEVKTTEQLFQMLELKRISTMAVQDTMAQQYIAIHNLSNVKQVEPAITTKDYYLVFSHQFMEANAELAEKIWQEIEQVRDDVYSKQKDKYLE